MNPIELGKFIAQLRSDKELTQEELAEKLFIDKRKVSRWECGTSVPEFDMLIKLSEILDVSLYEFSICQKITDDKISRRIINRFKNINDFRKHKRKNIIILIVLIVLLGFFISTTIYTFKNSNTVEIYELESLDDNYYIEGNFIKLDKYNILNITDLSSDNFKLNNCNSEIYVNNVRISSIMNNDEFSDNNKIQFHFEFNNLQLENNFLTIKLFCVDNKEIFNHSFDFEINKTYDNSFL